MVEFEVTPQLLVPLGVLTTPQHRVLELDRLLCLVRLRRSAQPSHPRLQQPAGLHQPHLPAAHSGVGERLQFPFLWRVDVTPQPCVSLGVNVTSPPRVLEPNRLRCLVRLQRSLRLSHRRPPDHLLLRCRPPDSLQLRYRPCKTVGLVSRPSGFCFIPS
ncbi:hypothetical protein AMECASPLE_023634 [Ameca splendens]|uniref:Uncharacterized protein n=1 Tax=Ameca splendens TaxID=208324 RepID=A0ABV0XTD4_9TELE